MKYYSDVTKQLYETPEALTKAEQSVKEAEEQKRVEQEKLTNARKAHAAQVDAARKKMVEAQQEYRNVLEDFCKKYGTYHTSVNLGEIPTLFEHFFDLF